MLKKIIFGFLVILSITACNKDSKCDYDECAVKAPNSEIQSVQNYLASQGITNAVQHCSGAFYVVDVLGTGSHPNACSHVNVTYKGTLTNGTVFDQRTTDFGLDGVIRGWTNTIPQLREGGKMHIYIPPTLGYGNQPNGTIPANSILIFEVTLNSVD